MSGSEAERFRAVLLSLIHSGDISQRGVLRLERVLAELSW